MCMHNGCDEMLTVQTTDILILIEHVYNILERLGHMENMQAQDNVW